MTAYRDELQAQRARADAAERQLRDMQANLAATKRPSRWQRFKTPWNDVKLGRHVELEEGQLGTVIERDEDQKTIIVRTKRHFDYLPDSVDHHKYHWDQGGCYGLWDPVPTALSDDPQQYTGDDGEADDAEELRDVAVELTAIKKQMRRQAARLATDGDVENAARLKSLADKL